MHALPAPAVLGDRVIAGTRGTYIIGKGLGKGMQGRVKLGRWVETGQVRRVATVCASGLWRGFDGVVVCVPRRMSR